VLSVDNLRKSWFQVGRHFGETLFSPPHQVVSLQGLSEKENSQFKFLRIKNVEASRPSEALASVEMLPSLFYMARLQWRTTQARDLMSNNFYCNKDSIIDHFPCLELFD
jgi:hypothetical protein